MRIFEDDDSRNMSYMKKNELYTAEPGGGPDSCNFANISRLLILREAAR
jgi:hypothetical protein